jgi:hypothetical protein
MTKRKGDAEAVRHLGLHLRLTPEDAVALDAMIAADQASVGERARVTVTSFVLGLLREEAKRRRLVKDEARR